MRNFKIYASRIKMGAKTILLEKHMAEMSRAIIDQTSGKLETKGKTVEMGEVEICKVSIQEI